MMERLREGANSFVVKIILALIIFSFVFAGVGNYLVGGSSAPAAKVGDREISQNDFEQVYQNERARMQNQAGEFFTALLGDPKYLAEFRRNVLDRMVNDVLLEEQAANLGMRISDQQIKDAILAMPQFQQGGSFDNEMYKAALRRAGFSPESFAEYMRRELVREQLVSGLQGSEFVLKGELDSLYKLENQTRRVSTLTLPVSDFSAKAEVTEDEMKEYYEANSSQFIRPEKYKIAYVEVSGKSIADNSQITDEEINAYYETNKASFSSAAQRKVSHILIEGDSDDAKQKAEALLSQLKAGADFATLAKENSADTFSAENGGELDWFEAGVMDAEFEKAAFAMTEKGQLSDVVKSSFGYHILKLDDLKEVESKPLETVKDEIIKRVKEQQAAEKFYELQTALSEKAFEMPDSLEDAAEAVNQKVVTTDFVSLDELKGSLANAAVIRALQSDEVLKDGLNSEVVEIAPEHIIAVRIEDSQPEIVLPFDQVSEKVKTSLSEQKGEKAAKSLADSLIAELVEGKTDALTQSGYSFTEAKDIARVSEQREVSRLAFTLGNPSEGEKRYGTTTDVNGDVVVIALEAVNQPDTKELEQSNPLATRVERTLATTNITATLQQLKEKTGVTYLVNGAEASE
ncbi:peptidylprolyl isomerase [Veronia pacifica]|uniref:Periplasmic chaperone PpiD n=1 Tax=Veronia pacifica TaxID=1080227 RepID=A0A1C3ERE0_9GAMM|nr:peptidylprolyl isomerase [Veronia pacifica]ODA35786.1 peptidylprolyl isomerase [Veronia pacifica]